MDERATLNDLSRSSLTFRIEDINITTLGNFNTKGVSSSISGTLQFNNDQTGLGKTQDIRRWNRKTDMKIDLKNSDYSFEMYKIFIVSLLVILPITAFHLYEYFSNEATGQRFKNSIYMYTQTALMLNTRNIMRGSLLSTVLWNDTKRFLAKKSSLAFVEASQAFREQIIPEYQAMETWDFGSEYSAFYSKITESYDVCSFVKEYGTKKAACTTSIIGFDTSNFIYYLRGVSSLMDDMFNTWQSNCDISAASILSVPKYNLYWSTTLNGWAIEDEIYYSLLILLTSTLKALLDPSLSIDNTNGVYSLDASQNSQSEYYITFVVPLTILTGVAFTVFVHLRLLQVVFDFWHTAFLLPVSIVKKNPLLGKYFKTLERRARTTISFF